MKRSATSPISLITSSRSSVPASDAVKITRSLPLGHVEAVPKTIRKLGLDDLIASGTLTDAEDRPVAVRVYPSNTGDPKNVPDQVETLTERFGLSRVVLVGDRGMLTQTQIDVLKKHPGLGWISALRSGSIHRLPADGLLVRNDREAQRDLEIRAETAVPQTRPTNTKRAVNF